MSVSWWSMMMVPGVSLCTAVATMMPVAVAGATTYTVAVEDPAADDANPGTADRPWRSLRHAAAQVQPGDTVHVMPGIYAESVTIAGEGDLNARAEPIRFIAAGDGPAVLDGAVRVRSDDVEATDTPRVFRWNAPQPLLRTSVNRPERPVAWVWWNDQRLALVHGRALTSDDTYSFSRHADHVMINLGSDEWPADAEVEVALLGHGFELQNVANVTLRGFELRRHAGDSIRLNGTVGCVIEDCHVVQPNLHGIYVNASRALTTRRVRVFEPNAWASNFKGQGHLIEENVFQTGGTRNETAGELWVGVLKFNGGSYLTVRHNFLADRAPAQVTVGDRVIDNAHVFGGIWGDIHCYDNRIYGNSIARQGHAGIYLEYLQNRNTVMFNTIQDSAMGITMRQSAGNVVRQNWVFDTAMLWGRDEVDTSGFPDFAGRPADHPQWGRERLDGIAIWQTFYDRPSKHNLILDNLIQVTGRAISIPVPRQMDRRMREDVAQFMMRDPGEIDTEFIADIDYRAFRDSFHTPLNNLVDRNLYVRSDERSFAGFAMYLDEEIADFDAYRQTTGFDAGGREGDFTPADIGLQVGWTVQEGSRHPDLPLAFDYDGGAERAVPVGRAVFARGIWLDAAPEPYGWFRAAGTSTEPGPAPGGTAHEPDWRNDARQWVRWPLSRSGMHALAVVNAGEASAIPEGGVGWRTASIPVSEGLQMNVSLHLNAEAIVPEREGEGVDVAVVFSDWTGHRVRRFQLVGGDTASGLEAGTYDWTRVEATVEVPEGMTRMIVYAGMHPATGRLLIDDLEMGMVDPGQ
jgi:hypothetical protein